MSDSLERIASELEQIRYLLERFMPIDPIPSPPEKLLGKESITYLNESSIVELEEEELRQINRGLNPGLQDE